MDPLFPPKSVNRSSPDLWKSDIALSVDMYNAWFMMFAPKAYRETRARVSDGVEVTLRTTMNLADVSVNMLRANPGFLPTLRMSTCPPIAADRLVGLAGVSKNLVAAMEANKLPARMSAPALEADLGRIGAVIEQMADPDIFVWLTRADNRATESEMHRAATIVADRLCGAVANPTIRNAQEKRQLAAIAGWLKARGYTQALDGTQFNAMTPGTFAFRINVPVHLASGATTINIPVDTVVMPRFATGDTFPLLIEAKSAGDFTNVNKRRKEEAAKLAQLRHTYGANVRFILFLCGYFDTGYLGYEAAEGIDWVWEHRIDELAEFEI